jgi:hypothetical protein
MTHHKCATVSLTSVSGRFHARGYASCHDCNYNVANAGGGVTTKNTVLAAASLSIKKAFPAVSENMSVCFKIHH